MKTHNAVIYHCLQCGSVEHCEPECATPRCCDRDMENAATETIFGDQDRVATRDVAEIQAVEFAPHALPQKG